MKKRDSKLLHNGAAAFFHDENSLSGLFDALCYRFNQKDLIKTALTHPSFSQKDNNQRLEFLGDAVLQLVISRALFLQKEDKEGKLTFKRQKLVNEKTLAKLARRVRLGDYLNLDASLHAQKGQNNPAILADAMEAVFAAVYLDGGFEKAEEVILHLFGDEIKKADAELDPKGRLQAIYQSRGEGEPAYVDILEEGPPHQRVFTVAVRKDGRDLASGSGKTKREAQQQAAINALQLMDKGGEPDEADQA